MIPGFMDWDGSIRWGSAGSRVTRWKCNSMVPRSGLVAAPTGTNLPVHSTSFPENKVGIWIRHQLNKNTVHLIDGGHKSCFANDKFYIAFSLEKNTQNELLNSVLERLSSSWAFDNKKLLRKWFLIDLSFLCLPGSSEPNIWLMHGLLRPNF